MRQAMVAGNWKMNGTRGNATALVDAILACVGEMSEVEVVLCPPFVYLTLMAERLGGGQLAYGGQNLDPHASGAYTGEISAAMLADMGCRYVIVGHSERRTLFGESNEVAAHKCKAAQESDLIPILCVGETLAERETDRTEAVIQVQLDTVVDTIGISAFERMVVAYEPVWAIGTGRTATPEQAQTVHRFVRERLAQGDKRVAAQLRILYGGSVKAANAQALFRQPDIDGGLVGGASLQASEFVEICRAVA